MSCYCDERLKTKALADSMTDVPEGYCGFCDVCGRPGHTRAHPSLPTSGAWCDEHWNELLTRPPVTPDLILRAVIVIFGIAVLGIAIVRMMGQ